MFISTFGEKNHDKVDVLWNKYIKHTEILISITSIKPTSDFDCWTIPLNSQPAYMSDMTSN